MNEQWILSVTDVAEALNCSTDDVLGFIATGELPTDSSEPPRVAHDALRTFVRERQRTALALGSNPRIVPDVLALRPGVTGFDHQV